MAVGPLHLADKSAWEQARYDPRARDRLHELREAGRLAVCLVSLAELLYSARNAAELAQLRVELAAPIIGQGLSNALRDARIVADILRSTADWSPGSFEPCAQERRERMRRLRLYAEILTDIYATFTPEGVARRRVWGTLWPNDPVLGGPEFAMVLGPEKVAAESYAAANLRRIRAVAA